MTWCEQAVEKLEKEAKAANCDRYGNVMKNAVLNKLKFFCGQDEEFAQAIVQGGTFGECMGVLQKAANGKPGLEDLIAYEEAVRFYFPGAGIVSTMRIDLCASVGGSEPEQKQDKAGAVILNLTDYL